MTEPHGDDLDVELDARLTQLAHRFDASPANDLADRAAARSTRNHAVRLVAAAAIVALVVGFGAVAVRSGDSIRTEVFSGPPGTSGAGSSAPTRPDVVPPTNVLGEAAIAGGRSGDLDWMIVRTPGDPPTGSCWRLDGPALAPGRTASCGFDVPGRPLGIKIEHTPQGALVWGPIADDVRSIQLRLADRAIDAEIVDAVDGSQRFYVAATPNGVVIDAVDASMVDGMVSNLFVGSAPCPCPPPDDPLETGHAILRPQADGTQQRIPMTCPNGLRPAVGPRSPGWETTLSTSMEVAGPLYDSVLCFPARADPSLALEPAELAAFPPSERDQVRQERIELIASYWRDARFPTASDDAGNPSAWATLDELADP